VIISNHIWAKKLISRSVCEDKLSIFINYPDEKIFYTRHKHNRSKRFVMIYPGTLNWHQGLDIAIKALAIIRDEVPQLEFHIYGDGSEKSNLEDLVQEAKRTGFFAVTFTTNGTLPIKSGADLIWVSIDGTREIHDQIRGKGSFDWLIENVEGSSHPRIYANMIINPLNYRVVEDVVKMVAQSKGFRAISMSFHTPHPGVEDLFLPWEKRKEVLDKVIELKKHGFPIINSFAGLNLHYSNKWKRRCWMNNFAFPDGEIHSECWGSRDGICDRCGYGMGAEMSALFDLKPSPIGAALRLFSGRI